jgi:hypothetical protein
LRRLDQLLQRLSVARGEARDIHVHGSGSKACGHRVQLGEVWDDRSQLRRVLLSSGNESTSQKKYHEDSHPQKITFRLKIENPRHARSAIAARFKSVRSDCVERADGLVHRLRFADATPARTVSGRFFSIEMTYYELNSSLIALNTHPGGSRRRALL